MQVFSLSDSGSEGAVLVGGQRVTVSAHKQLQCVRVAHLLAARRGASDCGLVLVSDDVDATNSPQKQRGDKRRIFTTLAFGDRATREQCRSAVWEAMGASALIWRLPADLLR